MQDRYAGDIGDYVKLSLLRALMPEHRLGIAWWMYPDEVSNGNGRHIGYLGEAAKWRPLDPDLFDKLAEIVSRGDRNVRSLEQSGVLPNAVFSSETVPTERLPAARRLERPAWFGRMKDKLAGCDIVFLDPDNGLEPTTFSLGSRVAGKSVGFAELQALAAPGRTLVVYHHHTRRKGGHRNELVYWADRLKDVGFRTVDAIRSSPYSPRAFFLLDAVPDIRERAKEFVARWPKWLSFHADAADASAAPAELTPVH